MSRILKPRVAWALEPAVCVSSWKKTGGMLAPDPLDPQAPALGPLGALAHIPEPLASGASGAWSGTSGPGPGPPPAPDPLDPQVLALASEPLASETLAAGSGPSGPGPGAF
jgi:hypothetical protein